jgi:hypothetical protein
MAVGVWAAIHLENTRRNRCTHRLGQKLVLYPTSVSLLSQAWRTRYHENCFLIATCLEVRRDQKCPKEPLSLRSAIQALKAATERIESQTEEPVLKVVAVDPYIEEALQEHHHLPISQTMTAFPVYTVSLLAVSRPVPHHVRMRATPLVHGRLPQDHRIIIHLPPLQHTQHLQCRNILPQALVIYPLDMDNLYRLYVMLLHA